MSPLEVLRTIDLCGPPVSLVYRGDSTFKTRVGGCCSLLLLFLCSTKLAFDLVQWQELTNNAQTITTQYVAIGSAKKEPWVLSSDFYALAGLTEVEGIHSAGEEFVRVQFYIYKNTVNQRVTSPSIQRSISGCRPYAARISSRTGLRRRPTPRSTWSSTTKIGFAPTLRALH